MKRLSGQVALVTGASRGIGMEVALRFAEEGAHVIAVARSTSGLAELDRRINAIGGSVTIEPLDLSDETAINRLGSKVAKRWGKLDVLVGNAAVHEPATPLEQFAPEVWRQAFAINVDANWHLIRAFGPLLKASDAGRAIFVTSRASLMKLPYVGAYCASKAALDAMVRSYAAEIAETPVRVNLLDPGPIRTQMRALAVPDENPETVPSPEVVAELFVEMALPSYTRNGKTVRFMEIGLRKRLRHWASSIKHRRFE